MSDPIDTAARAAAQRLGTHHDPQLVAEVEAALLKRGAPTTVDQYLDPISLGGLIVSVATLAWTVYNDRSGRDSCPSEEEVARAVTAQLGRTTTLDLAQHEQLITVIVQQTLAANDDEQAGL
jgi:hypothetical protein